MAAKRKELLEQEPAVIGIESSEAAGSGVILLEEMVDCTDASATAEKVKPELDELLSDMGPDLTGNAIPGSSDDESSCETADQEDSEVKVIRISGGASDPPPSAGPKRAARKKNDVRNTKVVKQSDAMEGSVASSFITEANGGETKALTAEMTEFTEDSAEGRELASVPSPPASRRASRGHPAAEAPVLTIEARSEVETAEERKDVIWHEVHNAYRVRRVLMGQLCGTEQTDSGKTIAVANYKGFRIVIPPKEMMVQVRRDPSGQAYTDLMLRQNRILNNMLGAHIGFVIKGIDSKVRSVVASRQEVVLKRRQIFYLDSDSTGIYRIYEGRAVQARVIAVVEKAIRVEILGIERPIMVRDLAWNWVRDTHERFSVGDEVLVRAFGMRRDNLEEISVKVGIRNAIQNNDNENLRKCRIQSECTGKATDVHRGVIYVRLSNGVNAAAHSYYNQRMPGKRDDVSFAVTRIGEEHDVAIGITAHIIRQNL